MEKNDYKKVNLHVGVDQLEPYENLFQVGYNLDMHQDFIENKEGKKHNINSHSKWLRDTVKINNLKEELAEIKKWKICFVNFGVNIGTEINGIRPAIIYKSNEYRYGEDVIVLPITSFEDETTKSKDVFDVEIESNLENGWIINHG